MRKFIAVTGVVSGADAMQLLRTKQACDSNSGAGASPSAGKKQDKVNRAAGSHPPAKSDAASNADDAEHDRDVSKHLAEDRVAVLQDWSTLVAKATASLQAARDAVPDEKRAKTIFALKDIDNASYHQSARRKAVFPPLDPDVALLEAEVDKLNKELKEVAQDGEFDLELLRGE